MEGCQRVPIILYVTSTVRFPFITTNPLIRWNRHSGRRTTNSYPNLGLNRMETMYAGSRGRTKLEWLDDATVESGRQEVNGVIYQAA